MRRHLSYANVAATLALVFAMSGSAIAAKHYLLSSTRQIKPSVLKKLRGNVGPRGATGPAGAPGAPGATGPSGASAGTPTSGATGATILSEPLVGVSVAAVPHSFQFSNTNSADKVTISGVVETSGEKLFPWQASVAPGETAISPSNGALTRFLDVTVVRAGSTAAASPLLHVTCGNADAGAEADNCVATH